MLGRGHLWAICDTLLSGCRAADTKWGLSTECHLFSSMVWGSCSLCRQPGSLPEPHDTRSSQRHAGAKCLAVDSSRATASREGEKTTQGPFSHWGTQSWSSPKSYHLQPHVEQAWEWETERPFLKENKTRFQNVKTFGHLTNWRHSRVTYK